MDYHPYPIVANRQKGQALAGPPSFNRTFRHPGLHLTHQTMGAVADTGTSRFFTRLLTRLLIIPIVTELLQQTFLIHNLLETLQRTLNRLAFLQSKLDHASHPLPKTSDADPAHPGHPNAFSGKSERIGYQNPTPSVNRKPVLKNRRAHQCFSPIPTRIGKQPKQLVKKREEERGLTRPRSFRFSHVVTDRFLV